MIGQQISHYRILEKLGEGGMGVVYKAQDTKLDRVVALKFLPEQVSASEPEKARFIQEAKAAASLNHTNICTIHGVDDHEGRLFIVMEFVEGKTLREIRDNVSTKQVFDIGIQLADGLAAAHEKGIVHRDVKPENIMIRKDGRVQIMDFGLAKLKGVSRLTKEGSTIGTVGYMSPEQVQGQDADHRTDIFSLGVVLYELFTGQLPFKGLHEMAITYEIVNVDPAPMSSVKPEIPPELDAIALECLAKEPSERYQSAAEVAKDLKRLKRESTKQRLTRTVVTRQFAKSSEEEIVKGAGRILSRRLLWPVAAAALGAAVVLLAWSPWCSESLANRGVIRFGINLPSAVSFLRGSSALALSPDGNHIACLAGQLETAQLYLRPMDDLTVQIIPGTEGANDPFFSPEGQWIAFEARGRLKKVSIFGGAPQDICDVEGQIRGGWWEPDGTIYFGHISMGVNRVAASGGTTETVTLLDSVSGEISHRFPQILPDGRTVMFTIKHKNIATFDEAVIAAEDIVTHERKILFRGGSYARYVPTGHLIYARGKSLFAAPFDVKKLEVTGPPVSLFEGGMFNQFSGAANFDFSRTGTLVYVPYGALSFDNNIIVWMNRRGSILPLLDKQRPYFEASLSPDGQKLALTIQAANDDIWVYHIGRGTLTRLTFGGGNHGGPIWTADGGHVVYYAEKGRLPNIFRKSWDGSGAEERLTDNTNAQFPSSFTPDGRMMAFVQGGDIWILPLTDKRQPWPIVQSPSNEYRAVFSPDGRWMAYVSNESGRDEVYVVPFPKRSGKWQISTNGGSDVRWSSNGRELFYLNGRTVMTAEVVVKSTFDFSPSRKLFDLPTSAYGLFDPSLDARRFVVGLTRAQELNITQMNVVINWFEELKNRFAVNKP